MKMETIDPDLRLRLNKAKKKLYPFHIRQYGQLQEWYKDWDDPNDKHRHISHLFGLFPGKEISATNAPELAAAVPTLVYSTRILRFRLMGISALFTVYSIPEYKKNENAKLQSLDLKIEYTIDFKTEKDKTYTVIPL